GLSDGLCENFHHRKTSTSIRVATRRVLESPCYTLVYDEPVIRTRSDLHSGTRQCPADRLDSEFVTMIIDEIIDICQRRSSSAWAKYALAFRRISLAR